MVEVQLDKVRRLKFDLAAMRGLESALGDRATGRILGDISTMSINTLVVATYHGLKHEDPSLNPKLVEKILQTMLDEGRTLAPLYEALPKALEATGLFRVEDNEGKSQTPAPV